jgi:hypothetical protein
VESEKGVMPFESKAKIASGIRGFIRTSIENLLREELAA